MKKPKNILVTGGAGFIGSHLCDRLIAEGHQVTCLDNLFTGSMQNIQGLIRHERFVFVEADVVSMDTGAASYDVIFNLACPASPRAYQHDPVSTITTNVIGMRNVLELARKTNAAVIQASTSEVYGDPQVHPQPEEYWGNVNFLGPRACYDEGKRCAETLCMDYHRQYGVDTKIVRIFNTYGPRMAEDDGRVISNFIVQALKGTDITVYGDGSQTRSFQYVDDCIEALLLMMNANDFYGPVNIGNPQEFAISDIAEKVIAETQSKSRIVYHLLPQDDPKQRRPNIALAKQRLEWGPVVPFAEGLTRTVAYFKTRIAP